MDDHGHQMAAAGLQRSSETFRRSGSSGLVWEDRFLPGEQPAPLVFDNDKVDDDDDGGKGQKPDEAGEGDGGPRMKPVRTDRRHRTGRSASPTQDPPSPRVSTCGCCGLLFGKSDAGKTTGAAANRRRHR